MGLPAGILGGLFSGRRRFVVYAFFTLALFALMFSGSFDEAEWTQVDVKYLATSNSSHVLRPSNLTERPTVNYHATKRPGYELPFANGIPLRILALGASTTRGDSPEDVDNNGFRRPLRDRLVSIGNAVNFVGSQRLGNMTDNDFEAGPGVQIGTIHAMAKGVVPKTKPNLILVNAGTNDCLMHVDIGNFYKRYDALVQYLLTVSHQATIVLGTLLPTWDTHFNGREDVFKVNKQIRRLAKIYAKQGLPIVLAEMAGPDGIQDQNISRDGMHPGLPGYEMMATKLFMAIAEADAKGFLQLPEHVYGIPDDGEETRKDDAYQKWHETKTKAEKASFLDEEREMNRMEAELEQARMQRMSLV